VQEEEAATAGLHCNRRAIERARERERESARVTNCKSSANAALLTSLELFNRVVCVCVRDICRHRNKNKNKSNKQQAHGAFAMVLYVAYCHCNG